MAKSKTSKAVAKIVEKDAQNHTNSMAFDYEPIYATGARKSLSRPLDFMMLNQIAQDYCAFSIRPDAVRSYVTDAVLEELPDDVIDEPLYCVESIMYAVRRAYAIHNSTVPAKEGWRLPTEITSTQLSKYIFYAIPTFGIAMSGFSADRSTDLLAFYQASGRDRGIYTTDTKCIESLVDLLGVERKDKILLETLNTLKARAIRARVCTNPDYVPVNNGIFDYKTKQLLPFSASYVFLHKSRVNYNPNAVNPVIHNDEDGTDWDIESWMKQVAPDEETAELLWKILGACVRTNVSWDKAAWLYSEQGNNGKGTFCEIARALVGEGSYASIPLSDMGKDFALEPLVRSMAVITDENDVGTYIDKAANLKALITGDVVPINRKFKDIIMARFHGFMIQCLNEQPRIKDKSESFFRRCLLVPFDKCFTGKERKYIKHEYLKRTDVQEYILWRVLNMDDYYDLEPSQVCQQALNSYRSNVDSTRAFLEEMLPVVKWDLLPFDFLYDLFRGWYRRNVGSDHSCMSKSMFTREVRRLADEFPAWEITVNSAVRPSDRMDEEEPLIEVYNLDAWADNSKRTPSDPFRHCVPAKLAPAYRGLYRVVRQKGSDEDVLADALAQDQDCDNVIAID